MAKLCTWRVPYWAALTGAESACAVSIRGTQDEDDATRQEGRRHTAKVIYSDALARDAGNEGLGMAGEEFDTGDGLGTGKLLVRLLLGGEGADIEVIDVHAEIIAHPVKTGGKQVAGAEGDGVAFSLMLDGKRMGEVRVGTAGIDFEQACLSRCRADCDEMLVGLGPIEGSEVGKLVACGQLFPANVGLVDMVNLTQAEAVASNVYDDEVRRQVERMRRPADCGFHLISDGERWESGGRKRERGHVTSRSELQA